VLRKLLAEGLVERLHDFKGVPDMVGVWRWTADAPTVGELAEQASRCGVE
jgi:hypothetical protein